MCGFQGTRNRRMKRGCAERSQVGGPGYEATGRKPRERRPAQTLQGIPVVMAKGIHLFPYRTQKLSLSAPMVLAWRRAGRVGRCRIPQKKAPHECGVFSFVWTAIRQVDTKNNPRRRIARHYAALLRISNGVRPFFISMRW